MTPSSPTAAPETDPNFLPLPNRRKVVIRDLPPALTEEQLLADLERLGISKSTVDYFHFVPGHIPKRNIIAALHMGGSTFHFDPATAAGGKRPRPGQCYLQFKTPQEPIDFAQQYNGHVFVDSRGVQYPVRVEFALYQKVPADWADEVKANPMEGTWKETPEFQQWMQMKEEAAKKAKEPVVFDIQGGVADEPPEPPKNALLSKVAKNAQKLLAKARTKANPGGSEPLAASVPVGPSPVAMAILTPKGPKTTPLIEYLKQQREKKLNKAKGSTSAGSNARASKQPPGKVQIEKKQHGAPSVAANVKQQQQASSRPGSPAAGSGKDAAGAAGSTNSASDKKARIKEQLKEKRKEKDRERRERKKAERAAAKTTGSASVSGNAESSSATQEPMAKLPTPPTSKKAAAKLMKEMAGFTPTGIQKRVHSPPSSTFAMESPAPAPADDDETPVLPFSLVQMSSPSSENQRTSSTSRIASRAASPASVSSTAAQRGSSTATSMLSFTSTEALADPKDPGRGADSEDEHEEQLSQQPDESNLSPEERARLEKLRIKREKRKEKAKEKRKAERLAVKEAKKAARVAAEAAGASADGTQSQVADSTQPASAEVGQRGEQQSEKEDGGKQKRDKRKRERPDRNIKKGKEQFDSSVKTSVEENLQVSSEERSSVNETADDKTTCNSADTQPSWANNDQPATWHSSSTATSQPSAPTPSTHGGNSARGNTVRGGERGNRRESVPSNPPKSAPVKPVKEPSGEDLSDWTTNDHASAADWNSSSNAADPQRPLRHGADGQRAGARGGMVRGRGGRGGFVQRDAAKPPSQVPASQTNPGSAADWATSEYANPSDWTSDSPASNQQQQQQQQSRRDNPSSARGGSNRGGFSAGNRGRGAAFRGGRGGGVRGGGVRGGSSTSATGRSTGDFASVSDWAAASGAGADWSSAEPATGSAGADWAGTGEASGANGSGASREGPTASNRGGRGGAQAHLRGGRGGARGGVRGPLRGGRGGGPAGPGREAQAQGGADAGSSSWMHE